MSTMTSHQPVLLQEAIDELHINPDGVYIDGTFGRGGHSRAVLAKLSENGRLYAVDKDPEAIAEGQKLMTQDKRFTIEHSSFADLQALMMGRGLVGKVDGILLDLGVSSPQIDDASRGFSFMRDGPLDMRMNTEATLDAAHWVNTAKEQQIANVIDELGEEKFSRRIAKAIVAERVAKPITTTKQLATIVANAVPRKDPNKHPATRTFQAIRIFINQELQDLQIALEQSLELLAPGGRLAVISFHSLEDRIVKRFIRFHQRGGDVPAKLPVPDSALDRKLKKVGRAIKASGQEIATNPRARSAVLRIAERL